MQNKHHNLTEDQENIKFLLENAPFKLDCKDSIVQELGLYYLPYSTGFEIECFMIPEFGLDHVWSEFKYIPNIMEIDINKGGEQRFRIPKGIDGIVCLFYIAEKMRRYAYPNPESGIHYHVDCTDVYDKFDDDFIESHANWVLKELDTWNYKGNYNTRKFVFGVGHNWVRFQNSFKTAEFRIGEMTFDYNLLLKRISHANDIMRRVKAQLVPISQRYGHDAKEIINNRKIQI
jgi:hypothetical protein